MGIHNASDNRHAALDTKVKCYQACAANPECKGYGWKSSGSQCHLAGEQCTFGGSESGLSWYTLDRDCLTAPQALHVIEDLVKLEPPDGSLKFTVSPLDDNKDVRALVDPNNNKLKSNTVLKLEVWCEFLDACLTNVEYCEEPNKKG